MFIVQPENRFGHYICSELLSERDGQLQWHAAEFAVAWSNYSGVNKLFDSLSNFISRSGVLLVTVGLDFGSTTYEGLGRLLELERIGKISTYVFFDENRACTFHPKVFLFRNKEEARLVVGSNNMTGAGLETNIEASLGLSGKLDDKIIKEACHALNNWRDQIKDSRIKRLTRDFLEQLRDRGYVLTEEELHTKRRSEQKLRHVGESPLFGRSSIRPLRPGRNTKGVVGDVGKTTGSLLGDVLLMRVRPRRNGNQIQISMKILEASFMHGVEQVVSKGGTIRQIGYNLARGNRNTARFEAPEMKDMNNPVARFQWVNLSPPRKKSKIVLQYEIIDAEKSEEGKAILKKLEEGITTPPITKLEELSQEETVLSTTKRSSAQWYRLDSV